jgi:acetyl-CoA carboxylase carboxyltransferase component
MSEPTDWKPLLDEHARRHRAAHAMGGDDKLAKQHEGGRYDARQRIDRLCDRGSFREVGALTGGVSYHGERPAPADALVGGTARIGGRPIAVWSEDFTVQGGSIGHGSHAKRVRLARLALQERMPIVMLLEGAGERASNALTRYPYAPNDLQVLTECSGQVPIVAAVMGASAGHGALTGLLADFVVIVEGAALFSAGPPLVAAALGEHVSKEQLGGARMHAAESGVAHNLAVTEDEALKLVRDYRGFPPPRAGAPPPRHDSSDDQSARTLDGILDLIPADPHKAYDVRKLVAMMVDDGEALEVQPLFGASIVTVLARLGGEPVAIVANQPTVMAGAITAEAADKAAHFLEVAGAFHLPVVFLADNPGIMAGSQAERHGTLRSAARMFAAQAALGSPKLHVTVRKAFGFGSSLMAMNPFDGQTTTMAFPGVTLGGLPAGSGGAAAKMDAAARADLDAAQAEGAWRPADNMSYDEVIDPRELRNALLAALKLAGGRRNVSAAPSRRTGIRP